MTESGLLVFFFSLSFYPDCLVFRKRRVHSSTGFVLSDCAHDTVVFRFKCLFNCRVTVRARRSIDWFLWDARNIGELQKKEVARFFLLCRSEFLIFEVRNYFKNEIGILVYILLYY